MFDVKVGDTVVCVDDTGTAPNFNEVDPNYPAMELQEGREYVVRWIGHHTDPFYEGMYLGVRLQGVVRPVDPVSGVEDKPFHFRRFRPVVSGSKLRELEVEHG